MARSPHTSAAEPAPAPQASPARIAAEAVRAYIDRYGTHRDRDLWDAADRWLRHADSEGVA